MTSQGLDPWDFTRKIPNVFFTAICGSILMTSIFLNSYDVLLNFRKNNIFEKVKIEEFPNKRFPKVRAIQTVPKIYGFAKKNAYEGRYSRELKF